MAVAAMSEADIVACWLNRVITKRQFTTEEDGPVTVIFPGQPNDDHGPDFRDAIIATRYGLLAGDIEIHVASSGWRSHRHHLDPAYNRVILHVVYRHDTAGAAVTAAGRKVPTLSLERNLSVFTGGTIAPPLPRLDAILPCHNAAGKINKQCLEEIFITAGQERFLKKAEAFQQRLENNEPQQVLFESLMSALGYTRNSEPMLHLAQAIPLRVLEQLPVDGEATCAGILLGAAGLLPSQRSYRIAGKSHNYVNHLELAWKETGMKQVLVESDWHFSKVRPGNYPVRRLVAIATLLRRNEAGRLFPAVMATLSQPDMLQDKRYLTSMFIVPAAGYWRKYLDFGQRCTGIPPALCGAGRASDIIINVIFPLALAWYRQEGQSEKATAIAAAYAAYPDIEDNTHLRRLETRLGIKHRTTVPAVQRQGLLHIEKNYCASGTCHSCPLALDYR